MPLVRVVVAGLFIVTAVQSTPLDDYVSKPNPEFKWEDTGQVIKPNVSDTTAYVLNVTSGTWLDPTKVVGPHGNVWTHQVAIIKPATITRKTTAVAVMTGGCNENPKPVDDDEEYLDVAAQIAQRTGAVAIVIYQIPNCHMVFPSDPSKKKREEDALIGWAWREFLDDPTHDPEWLPRLPMVRGGMASMKAAEEYMTQQKWGDISAGGWVVAGASKRGWTTWMVGAVTCDTCVTIKGIIPMVPIVPSLKEEVRRQYQSYNGFTFAFADYMEAGILTRFDEPAVTTMLSIVQPDEYAGRLARLPKLAVLSSDDEFMQMDWTELWPFDATGSSSDTPNDMHLMIAPNSEHSLTTGIPEVLASISAFVASVADDEPTRPSFNVTQDTATGELTVTVDPHFKPSKVVLRHAQTLQSKLRDFRWVRLDDNTSATERCVKPGKLIPPGEGGGNCFEPIVWYPKPLTAESKAQPNVFKAKPPAPTKAGRWVGYYIELYFPSKTLEFDHLQVTTPGYIWPNTLPFANCTDFKTCPIKLV